MSAAADGNVLLAVGPEADHTSSSFFLDDRTPDSRDRMTAPALTSFDNVTYKAVPHRAR
ncbi:hypothetical protein [Nocardia sp. NPDC005745]|uniref:hypothetical protein n=1 Tax=Nocardia sp. NPDC005745 TaxID=3157061 RepID=UPI0033CBE6D8